MRASSAKSTAPVAATSARRSLSSCQSVSASASTSAICGNAMSKTDSHDPRRAAGNACHASSAVNDRTGASRTAIVRSISSSALCALRRRARIRRARVQAVFERGDVETREVVVVERDEREVGVVQPERAIVVDDVLGQSIERRERQAGRPARVPRAQRPPRRADRRPRSRKTAAGCASCGRRWRRSRASSRPSACRRCTRRTPPIAAARRRRISPCPRRRRCSCRPTCASRGLRRRRPCRSKRPPCTAASSNTATDVMRLLRNQPRY